jgi:cytoskeletal protein CcmA (bactofilin family)
MFSKGKAPEAQPTMAMPSPSPAPAPVKKPGGRSTPSIISADLLVQGTLVSQGDMQIDGTVEGDIRSVTLMIGNGAVVKGEVVAEEIVIRGRVEGRIRARRVQLDASAVVIGDILQEQLTVAAGATFEGTCRRSSDPLNLQAPTPQLTLSKAPQAVGDKPALVQTEAKSA